MSRVNVVEYKGELRKCLDCKDVKIWDYPNERSCPQAINPDRPRHRWRPYKEGWMTEEEKQSIDSQIEADKKVNHRSQTIFTNLAKSEGEGNDD